ncbi:MAG: hypothetical protein GF398_07620 [Chitinivibrionales bacterium]|nr:hypothetical protein [Chitinivibrionales bacterium]
MTTTIHFLKKASIFGAFLLVVGMHLNVKADGLPGEFISTQRWHDLFARYSPLTNPAIITEANYLGARFAFSPTLGNAFKIIDLGVTIPVGLYQSVAVSWFFLTPGSYEIYSINRSTNIWEPNGTTSSSENYFMLSYAINPWNRLSVGANLNFVYQSLFPGTENAEKRFNENFIPGIDIGATYRLFRHPLAGNHVIGINLQNLIYAPTIGEESFPANLRISWLATFWEKRIESGIDFDIKDVVAQADKFQDGDKQIEWELYGRVGTWLLRVFKLYFLFGSNGSGAPDAEIDVPWGLAGGINIPSVNIGRDLELLYQYHAVDGPAINTHTIYLRADLGKHREEIYARKMARQLDASPNDLYNKALTLYHQQKYWEAFFVFGQILSQFPDFFKNDWVNYYLHSCQEELDMRQASQSGYAEAINKYPQSEIVPYADLGIMRVVYREGDNAKVSDQFAKLNQLGVPDSLKYHAYYLMGQTHMRNKDYSKAIQLFNLIPEGHPEYIFGQHSLGVCQVLSDNMQAAMVALENAIQSEATTSTQKEGVNRSYLLIGYLFYEELSLSKAVTALRSIPAGSYYYEDALLGLGWSAIKARQWADCMDAGVKLQKTSNKEVIQCEGMLLEAYALLMRKNYGQALDVLQKAYDKINKVSPPSKEQLATRTQQYAQEREDYGEVAASAYDLALVRQTSAVIKLIDSLHVEQKSSKQNIDEHLKFSDEFVRSGFFSRGIDKIKEDLEYALATAEKLSGTSATPAKPVEETEELDEEIQKLQEEMRKLEEEQ